MHVRALCDSRNIVFLSKKWLETGSNLLRGFMFHINKNICLSSFTYGMFACCKQEEISILYSYFSVYLYTLIRWTMSFPIFLLFLLQTESREGAQEPHGAIPEVSSSVALASADQV